MQHPDEGTIHAWLDGALSAEDSAALDAHLASCTECSAAVAEARGLIAASSRIVSALDIVPSGVIPARTPVARPWYMSTQLRAAAAVLFIAGTSFVLFTSRDGETLSTVSERVMADQPAPALAESTDAAEQARSVEPPAATGAAANAPAPRAAAPAQRKTESARTETVVADAAASAEAAQSATEVVPPPAAPEPAPMVAAAPAVVPPSDTAAFSKRSILTSPVVVTGVTVTAASSDLRILSVDSSANTRITRYRIASGAELTLVETEPVAEGLSAARERRFDARPAAASPPLRQAEGVPVETISWTDPETKRTYTLSGRVPRETLEEVKRKIQENP